MTRVHFEHALALFKVSPARSLVLLLGCGLSDAALAQESPSNGHQLSGQLAEIVVTAQKRVEDIKDIPVSVSAFSGDMLRDQKITNYEDISRAIPGVSFTAGGSQGMSTVEIRGVSSASGSATVGIYMDEVPITVTNSPTSGSSYDGNTEPKLFDMERVEVLRGPQGTLYGSSSMGGTIRFIANQPDATRFASDVALDVSDTRHGSVNEQASLVINAPIIENKLAVRAGFQFTNDSGWIDHYSLTGERDRTGVNNERAYTVRLSAKYRPSDTLSFVPTIYFQHDTMEDSSNIFPSLGIYQQAKHVAEWGKDDLGIASLTVNANVGFADLTSVTSYFWREHNRLTDGTYYNSAILAYAFLDYLYPQFQPQNDSIIANLVSPSPFRIVHHRVAQEFRLSSHEMSIGQLPVKLTGGAYFENYWDTRVNAPEIITGLGAAFQQIYGFNINNSLLGNGDPNFFANDNVWTEYISSYQRQYAAFGQFEVNFRPDLHGSVGLRYLFARTSQDRTGIGFYNLGVPNPFYVSSSYHAATPRVSLTYDVTPQTSTYATIAKGFRLGGPTGPTPQGPGNSCAVTGDYATFGITNPPSQFDSDSLWSYEVGTKSRLLDNHLSLNGAVYYIDWKNIQQTILLPTCGFAFTANVGNAENYGAELEILYKLTAGLELGLSGGLQHAQITSTNNPLTAAVGEHVLGVPGWTTAVSAKYSWPVHGNALASIRANYNVTGPSYGSYQVSNSNYYDPRYAVVDMSGGVEFDRFDVRLYAKNLTNDSTIIQKPNVNSVIEGYTLRPRTIGVSASMKF